MCMAEQKEGGRERERECARQRAGGGWCGRDKHTVLIRVETSPFYQNIQEGILVAEFFDSTPHTHQHDLIGDQHHLPSTAVRLGT